jgi:hypothetical protein
MDAIIPQPPVSLLILVCISDIELEEEERMKDDLFNGDATSQYHPVLRLLKPEVPALLTPHQYLPHGVDGLVHLLGDQ